DRAPQPARKRKPSGFGRHVTGRLLTAIPEEIALHLGGEVLAGPRIGQAQAVLVDEHRLVAQPVLPGLLRDLLVDPLADLAGVGREIQPLGLLAELDAVDHPGHGSNSLVAYQWRPAARSH